MKDVLISDSQILLKFLYHSQKDYGMSLKTKDVKSKKLQ